MACRRPSYQKSQPKPHVFKRTKKNIPPMHSNVINPANYVANSLSTNPPLYFIPSNYNVNNAQSQYNFNVPPQVQVSGFGETWWFPLGAQLDFVLSVICADKGEEYKGRFMLEAVKEGMPPVPCGSLLLPANGWDFVVRASTPQLDNFRIRSVVNKMCCVCWEMPRTHVITPCNHMMCGECAMQMCKIREQCPICCHGTIEGTMEIQCLYEPQFAPVTRRHEE